MPYIPYIPLPPVTAATGAVSGYTNGAFTTPDYTLILNEIAKQINLLQFQFSNAAIKDIGSAAASLSSSASSSGLLVKQIGATNELLKTLNGNVVLVANKMEIVARGMASLSGHAAESVVTSQMALSDQVKNNKHGQLTTEAAQVAAGLPKTEVTAELNLETIKETINNVGVVKAQAGIAGLAADASAQALGYATTTVTTWIAESAVFGWFKDQYTTVELYVKGLFVKEKAIAVAIDKAADNNIIMSGNPTVPGNIG
jgi:hypothetical protein